MIPAPNKLQKGVMAAARQGTTPEGPAELLGRARIRTAEPGERAERAEPGVPVASALGVVRVEQGVQGRPAGPAGLEVRAPAPAVQAAVRPAVGSREVPEGWEERVEARGAQAGVPRAVLAERAVSAVPQAVATRAGRAAPGARVVPATAAVPAGAALMATPAAAPALRSATAATEGLAVRRAHPHRASPLPEEQVAAAAMEGRVNLVRPLGEPEAPAERVASLPTNPEVRGRMEVPVARVEPEVHRTRRTTPVSEARAAREQLAPPASRRASEARVAKAARAEMGPPDMRDRAARAARAE